MPLNNSFSETSGNNFLKTSIQNSFIDSKELSLLDNLEFNTPVHGIISEVFQVENSYFTENDWKVQDLDHRNDESMINLSENKNGSSCASEKKILWEENQDFFQEEDESDLLDMVDITFDSNEDDELVSFFSFLKTDGNDQDALQRTKGPIRASASFPDSDRTSSHDASKGFLKKRKLRRRLLHKKSSRRFSDELEDDDSSCKVKGVLYINQDIDALVQKSSNRFHIHNRSRRFPVDRSSLLRFVLTKNVNFSVL